MPTPRPARRHPTASILCCAATLAALTAELTSQSAETVIAYPQDTALSPTGSTVPLGYFQIAGTRESRFQMLIPATSLPTRPSTVTALAFVGGEPSADMFYDLLEITVSPTTRTTLAPQFDDNLEAPMRVLDHLDQVSWTAQQWTRLPLDRPFSLDGASALVVEIRASGVGSTPASHTGSTFLHGSGFTIPPLALPPNVPAAMHTTGAAGSGAASAATATEVMAPLQVRLYTDTPTLTLRSDPFPQFATFAPNGTVEAAVYAPAGAIYCTLIGDAFRAPFTLPGVTGAGLLLPIGELPIGIVPASGRDAVSFKIPAGSALVGQTFMLQAGLAAAGAPPTFTNGAEFMVRSDS
ncbi:MAG: hypothetical protein AAF628_22815 [Planctomycetota bacterium]